MSREIGFSNRVTFRYTYLAISLSESMLHIPQNKNFFVMVPKTSKDASSTMD
jgi:hypothetical protein